MSGSITVSGVNVKDYSLETLRDSISYALQKSVLFSGTIKENILWGNADASFEDVVEVCKIAQIHDYIMTLDKVMIIRLKGWCKRFWRSKRQDWP